MSKLKNISPAVMAGLLFVSNLPGSALQTQKINMREPFSLELPDLGGMRLTGVEARVPTSDLHELRLHIAKQFSDRMNVGKIYTRINGESAVTIQGVTHGRDGYVVACNLDLKPRFRLKPGKNVIEIQAIDRDGLEYYASYVLIAAGRHNQDIAAPANVVVETFQGGAQADKQPPVVYVTEPVGGARPNAAGTVSVRGVVGDDSGEVESVSINGLAASLTPVSRNRALATKPLEGFQNSALLREFSQITPVGQETSSIIIEARDRAGNLTRVSLPVRRSQPLVSPKFTGRKFAVIIGVSRYKYHDGGLGDLDFADADARSMRDFLVMPRGGAFGRSDILYLENEGATIEATRAALTRFLPRAGADDLIFIFVAGHGAPDPYAPQNLYFLLHDTKVADMPSTALPMGELQEALSHGVRAQRVVIFVDTCHSAGLTGNKLTAARGLENNLVNLYASKLYRESGVAVITSSDVNELSEESPRWGHGVFTLALLEGLRGEADINADKLITAGELFTYVSDRVRIETGFRQNPQALSGLNKDLTLAVASK